MLTPISGHLHVGVDIGSRCHAVAIGLSDGRLLEEFEIAHSAAGFEDFFSRIEGVEPRRTMTASGRFKKSCRSLSLVLTRKG